MGHRAIGEQIDQPVFALVEFLQLAVQVGVQLSGGVLLVGDDLFEQASRRGGEVGRQLQGAVVVEDRFFDGLGRQVGEVAEALFAPAADEVGVPHSVAAGGDVVDQPGGGVLVSAACAEQPPFQVVGVYAVPGAVAAAFAQDVLHTFEEFVVDQWLVPAWIDLAFPGDVADVVGIAQHVVEGRRGDGAWIRAGAGRAGCEAHVGHCCFEVLDRVIAGRVEFPCPNDQ
nr:hypothetical protein [Nocardia africana]